MISWFRRLSTPTRRFRLVLQRRGLEKAWYAISTRAHQFNGKELILTSYGRPFEMSLKLPEFLAVMDTLAGRQLPHDFC